MLYLFTQPIPRTLIFADVQRNQHCQECKEPELASAPSTQDRFSSLPVPISMCVLYSTCIAVRIFQRNVIISRASYLILLGSSNLNLFICSRERCNGWIALQVFIRRGPSSKADVRGGYTTPRPTLFMLVTPQKHRRTVHNLPFQHLIVRNICFILSKYF